MSVAKLDKSRPEGHGEDSKAPSVSKGQFQQVGTYAETGGTVSVNQKTGRDQGGETGSA